MSEDSSVVASVTQQSRQRVPQPRTEYKASHGQHLEEYYPLNSIYVRPTMI